MSKWLNVGTLLGGGGGAVAAVVALWQVFQPSPIDSADKVVAALNSIRDAIESGRVVTSTGWQTALGPDETCILSFVGPTRDDTPQARFQLSCP